MAGAVQEKTKLIKLILLPAIIAAFILLQAPTASAAGSSNEQAGSWPQTNEIDALSWMVINASDGAVILEHNPDLAVFPASTIKLLTAVLFLESDLMESELTVSETAVALPPGSSKVGFRAGEKVMAGEVLAALLLASGNDAANVIAESVDGSIELFAKRMNARAVQLGMVNSNFTNPSGLHDPIQTTTARDMALLARYAWQFEEIQDLVSQDKYVMPPTNLHPYPGWAMIFNTNRLISFGEDVLASSYLENYLGFKTGSTYAAGYNLIAAAKSHDDREFISLLFGTDLEDPKGNVFIYSKVLLEEAARLSGAPSAEDVITTSSTANEETVTGTGTENTASGTASLEETSAAASSASGYLDDPGENSDPQDEQNLLLFQVLLAFAGILLAAGAIYIIRLRARIRLYRKYLKLRKSQKNNN